METAKRVVREANLIARQFHHLGTELAARATAQHMRRFWAPLLRTVLLNELREHGDRFSPAARQAAGLLSHPERERPSN
jgi:hypothetical protein